MQFFDKDILIGSTVNVSLMCLILVSGIGFFSTLVLQCVATIFY